MFFKTFEHDLVIPHTMKQVTLPTHRYYETVSGNFRSMTTILSILDDGGIDKWKIRVGAEEAKRVVNEATSIGNEMHEYVEQYLLNNLERSDLVDGHAKILFNRMLPILNEFELVKGCELSVFSKEFEYAGQVDEIVYHEGDLCIADNKNSRRPIDMSKEYVRRKIFKYILQCCGYAQAYYELYNERPTHGIIIIAEREGFTAKKFKFKLDSYYKDLYYLIDCYHNNKSPTESSFWKI